MKNELAKTVELDAVETVHDIYTQDPLKVYGHRYLSDCEGSHAEDTNSDIPAPLHGLENLPVLR